MNTVAASPETEATPKAHKLFAYAPIEADVPENHTDQRWFRVYWSAPHMGVYVGGCLDLEPTFKFFTTHGETRGELQPSQMREMAAMLLAAADFFESQEGQQP